MARIHFSVTTALPPATVLDALVDFSDQRAERWPNIDRDHYRVHGRGPNWAEVTEGTGVAWERERYEWDAEASTVRIRTLESNTWGAGSGWEYRLAPGPGGGTAVHVTVDRHGNGVRGKLLELAVALMGRRLLRSQMDSALRSLRA